MMLKNRDRPRSRINKSLNISFYIVYSMSTQKNSLSKRPRLGPKEVKVLAFLELNGGNMWEEDLYNKFVHAGKYQRIFYGRLYGLQRKGFIIIRQEPNPETGRMKKKVYLVK